MDRMQIRKDFVHSSICAAAGGLALILGGVLSDWNHMVPAFIITLLAIVSYFYIVFLVADRNWLDLRALFAGVWLGTLGLAAFRLAEYQEPWQMKTWILFAVTYVLFILGMSAGILFGRRVVPGILKKLSKPKLGRLELSYKPNRLFAICVIITGIGILCFIGSVLIRGYIPFFSDDITAYATFYTKFHLFSIAACNISGLCYYCLSTQPLSKIKKFLLLLCIFYSTILFPILIVSRAIFATSALSLTTVVFYRHGKKLWVLFTCVVVMLGVYLGISSLRGYTDDQLVAYFQPATITISQQSSNKDNSSVNGTTNTQATQATDATEETASPTEETVADATAATQSQTPDVPAPSNQTTFTLPPKVAFLYTYLTVGHDNFNEVVQNHTTYTYGARQLKPLNVFLRSDTLERLAAPPEWYCVRPYLPTVSLFGDAYYDFHTVGVILFAIFWSFVVGLLQSLYTVSGNPFALLILGNTMTPIGMSFFECWMSYFPHWMLWGTILIFLLCATVGLSPKKEKAQ